MAFQKKWKNDAGTKTYYAWRSMRSRCTNQSNTSYKNYGGRGIKVCDRWVNDYDAFFADMGEAPEGMSIDRIDVNGDYTPENCRWADIETQLSNRRNNVIIEHNGMSMTQNQWARHIGVHPDTLWRRINVYKMPIPKALSEGSLSKGWKHGTRHGYTKGCRCDQCREAHNAHCREMRKRRKQKQTDIAGYSALGGEISCGDS